MHELEDVLLSCVLELPAEQQLLIWLRFRQHLNSEAVARLLNMPIKDVQIAQMHALQHLSRILEQARSVGAR